ncbi:aminodeoxychorismate/anthranilate synthase component II [Rhizobium leguminosarum]|nr:aminodeoxychorismate/anthranilate synthase component II [Rhizobium leguminosarum]
MGDDFQMAIFGPGPGNPLDANDSRVIGILQKMRRRLETKMPFIAVCLSHQILCRHLGLSVESLRRPNQGLQRTIDYFGRKATVGFYNTFTARSPTAAFAERGQVVQVCRGADADEVYALRGAHFTSMLFHPESVLSIDGLELLTDEISRLRPQSEVDFEPQRWSLA